MGVVQGLSHITFIVSDVDRMERLLTDMERFFLIGDVWVAAMEGEPLPARSYNHVAFQIDEADYEDRLARIRALGLDVREGRPRASKARAARSTSTTTTATCSSTGTLEERLARYRQSIPSPRLRGEG